MHSYVQLVGTLWTVARLALLVHGMFQARILEWVAIFLLQGIVPTQGLNLGVFASLALAG